MTKAKSSFDVVLFVNSILFQELPARHSSRFQGGAGHYSSERPIFVDFPGIREYGRCQFLLTTFLPAVPFHDEFLARLTNII